MTTRRWTRTPLLLFAYDRPGLLAAIAQRLGQFEVVLHFAKIDTHLDQAVDVFYVTELDNRKIEAPDRLEAIQKSLMEAITTGNEPA